MDVEFTKISGERWLMEFRYRIVDRKDGGSIPPAAVTNRWQLRVLHRHQIVRNDFREFYYCSKLCKIHQTPANVPAFGRNAS